MVDVVNIQQEKKKDFFVTAAGTLGVVKLLPETLTFERTRVGLTETQQLTVWNRSSSNVSYAIHYTTDAVIEDDSTNPILQLTPALGKIPANSSQVIHVQFTPPGSSSKFS